MFWMGTTHKDSVKSDLSTYWDSSQKETSVEHYWNEEAVLEATGRSCE